MSSEFRSLSTKSGCCSLVMTFCDIKEKGAWRYSIHYSSKVHFLNGWCWFLSVIYLQGTAVFFITGTNKNTFQHQPQVLFWHIKSDQDVHAVYALVKFTSANQTISQRYSFVLCNHTQYAILNFVVCLSVRMTAWLELLPCHYCSCMMEWHSLPMYIRVLTESFKQLLKSLSCEA